MLMPPVQSATRIGHISELHIWFTNARYERSMIRKLSSGEYRLYSRKKDPKTGKRRNLGTFRTRAAAEKHERAVQFFKRRG
jgi:hypothetical protein